MEIVFDLPYERCLLRGHLVAAVQVIDRAEQEEYRLYYLEEDNEIICFFFFDLSSKERLHFRYFMAGSVDR